MQQLNVAGQVAGGGGGGGGGYAAAAGPRSLGDAPAAGGGGGGAVEVAGVAIALQAGDKLVAKSPSGTFRPGTVVSVAGASFVFNFDGFGHEHNATIALQVGSVRFPCQVASQSGAQRQCTANAWRKSAAGDETEILVHFEGFEDRPSNFCTDPQLLLDHLTAFVAKGRHRGGSLSAESSAIF